MARWAPLSDRLWAKVDRSGEYWVFTGHRNRNGYGRIQDDQRVMQAHRVSWELHNGREVPAGMCVCHACDNPPCVRPDHLFIGTAMDNKQDSLKKGRVKVPSTQRGERHHQARLTRSQVMTIRSRARAGENQRAIAAVFGVGQSVVSRIKNGRAWRRAVTEIAAP